MGHDAIQAANTIFCTKGGDEADYRLINRCLKIFCFDFQNIDDDHWNINYQWLYLYCTNKRIRLNCD